MANKNAKRLKILKRKKTINNNLINYLFYKHKLFNINL